MTSPPRASSSTSQNAENTGEAPGSRRSINDWVKAAERVLPIPAVLARALAMLDDDEADLSDIARLVETDPGLVTAILRVANSAAIAPPRAVDSILQALVLLGREGIRRAIIGGVLADQLAERNIEFLPLDAYWRLSLYCAAFAQLITEHLQTHGPSRANSDHLPWPIHRNAVGLAFLAGLLHGLGNLVVYSIDPRAGHRLALTNISRASNSKAADNETSIPNSPELQRDSATPKQSSDDALITDLERLEITQLGASSSAIGAAVARAWKLPNAIACAIEHHRRPTDFANDTDNCVPTNWLSDSVHVAYVLAHLCDIDSRDFREAPAADSAAFERLGLGDLLAHDAQAVTWLDRWLSSAERLYRRAESLRGGRFGNAEEPETAS